MSVGIAVGKTGLENKLDEEIIGKVDFNVMKLMPSERIKQIQVDPGETGKNYRTTIIWKYKSIFLKY